MAIGRIGMGGLPNLQQAYGGKSVGQAGGPSFMNHLQQAMGKVDQAQTNRDNVVEAMVTGEVGEVHDVMIAAEEAQLSLEMMIEVRNKLMEGYNSIMQMQV